MMRIPFAPRHGNEDAGAAGHGAMARMRSWTQERRRQRIRRDSFNTLLRIDGPVLEDVTGLSIEQVEHAAKLPIHIDALQALRAMRRQRPSE